MNRYVIDSTVFIALERGQIAHQDIAVRMANSQYVVSAMTASELLHGVEGSDTAVRRQKRLELVEAVLDTVPIVSFDLNVARIYARIWADLCRQGQEIGAHDTIIAATALSLDATVLTHNIRHFNRVDTLKVEAW